MVIVTCPEGHNIDGTLERLSGVAQIAGHVKRDQHGLLRFEYGGYTEIDWNSQQTVTRDGGTVFVCDNGDEWPGHKLIALRGGNR